MRARRAGVGFQQPVQAEPDTPVPEVFMRMGRIASMLLSIKMRGSVRVVTFVGRTALARGNGENIGIAWEPTEIDRKSVV